MFKFKALEPHLTGLAPALAAEKDDLENRSDVLPVPVKTLQPSEYL
jgi:hypothetical protein